LIVSCQAEAHEPLHGSELMAAMARAAAEGGAVGIRANGPEDILAICQTVSLPVIGIYKVDLPESEVRITPRLSDALQVAKAGASLIALDATCRRHPEGKSAGSLIQSVKQTTGCLVMADISTVDEGLAAAEAGADLVGTTLSGYTSYSPQQLDPDFDLIQRLSRSLVVPLIARGASLPRTERALDLGAFAVVVGAAMRPQWITRRFSQACWIEPFRLMLFRMIRNERYGRNRRWISVGRRLPPGWFLTRDRCWECVRCPACPVRAEIAMQEIAAAGEMLAALGGSLAGVVLKHRSGGPRARDCFTQCIPACLGWE
jgi:N-acylglucosamine-6-phosphate 2-epimerase